ncbi:polysaccharide deacetylase family protein [Sphaerisporangium perillae]|uniref:polysaccharide deacetylase family protein n=1 Tax=Sphaerisporangium perillae TaxID=2935860 RepID=UPI00201086DD|nr:polysaccharide deacetylase family protein [Sphaerisporangium perillae]
MSRLSLSGGIAFIVAITAGCGVTFPPSFGDRPATTLPSQPTVINFVDPSTVGGLSVRTASDDSAGLHVFTGYPAPAAAPALAARLKEVTAAAVRRFTAASASGADGRPAPAPTTSSAPSAPSELNVGGQLTAASGGVFGVRLRTGTLTGSTWRNSLRTYWYDADTRHVHDSADLLKDGTALGTLTSIVRNRLWAIGPEMNVNAVKPDRALFDSLNFNPHGDLVVEFDDGQVAPAPMGRIAIAVGKREATPLLSDFGQRAMAVVDSATPATLSASPPPEFTPPPDGGDPGDGGPSGGASGGGSRAGGRPDCSVTKCVALTFDDGPGPQTGRLLSILARYSARATFFTLGASAQARPDLLRQIVAAGHLVAAHSWSHRDLTTLDAHRISDELGRTQIAAGVAIGRTPSLMRAPYGHTDAKVATAARALNLSIVGWSVDTADARDPDPGSVARRAIDGTRPGAIVLMHESGPATAPALLRVLAALEAKGYAFVTVPELYGSRRMEPGRMYTEADSPPRRRRARPVETAGPPITPAVDRKALGNMGRRDI